LNAQKTYSFVPTHKDILCCHHTSKGEFRDPKVFYHRHDAYEIYLFIRGNANFYIEQACYNLQPGDLIIISPCETHRVVCLDDQVYERVFINVKKAAIDHLSTKQTNLFECFDLHPFGQKNLTKLSEDNMKHFIYITDKLLKVFESTEYGQDILAISYLCELLVFTNTMYQKSCYQAVNIMPVLVCDIMHYIEEHLCEEITLEKLSGKFYLSGTHISREFKKSTGLSIRYYILESRIALAIKHLNEGKNVSEACFMSGFLDYSNFIRSFTKIVGLSPGKLKKQSKSLNI
jgi:AraC-like DNA-binding protein